jgi:DNA-binding transcriptional MerR regulator
MKNLNLTIPGTTLKYSEAARNDSFSMIAPVLEATGGLTLSQLSTLTGLEGTTIQNWIKRGWVTATKGKKYSEKQVLRILLINMMRGPVKLEEIARLMEYVNGDVEDTSDDIIDDKTLYNILCRIIYTAEDEGAYSPEALRKLIANELSKCPQEVRVNEEKLLKAMFVMATGCRIAYLKNEMDKTLAEIQTEK